MSVILMPGQLLSDDQLDEQFRQAMRLPVAAAGELRLRGALQTLMGELLLRRSFKYDPRAQSMMLACRLRLRVLQNMVLSERAAEAFAVQRCDIRAWAEDLCAAADLLLHPLGRSVAFEAPEEIVEAPCAPRDLGWLLLELICNCAKHCPGEEICVGMELKGAARRKPHACVLCVECQGELDLERLHAAGNRQGSGVAAMRRTAFLHGGSLLWMERGGMSTAALRLPLQAARPQGIKSRRQGAEALPPELPDYVELLSDQLSMVYMALAPAIGENAG